MSQLMDLIGQRFGRLVVIERMINYKSGNSRWLCECDCGNRKVIIGSYLKNGHTKSCGCLRRDTREKKHTKNIYEVLGEIVKINITQSKFVLIDRVCLPAILKYRWCAKRDQKTWYAIAHIYKSDGCRTTFSMHRLIMGLDPGDSGEIDHNDGNGLNNLLNNLRVVSHSENQHNRHGKSSRNGKIPTSRYRGVCWDKSSRRWRAQIVNNSIHINLGNYEDELEASGIYERAKVIRDTGGTNEEIKSLNVSRCVKNFKE